MTCTQLFVVAVYALITIVVASLCFIVILIGVVLCMRVKVQQVNSDKGCVKYHQHVLATY